MKQHLKNPAIIPNGTLPIEKNKPRKRHPHKPVTIHRGNENTPYLKHRRKLRRLVF